MNDYEFANGSSHAGKAIIGLRPEHIATGDNLASAVSRTEAKVVLVEPMGSDTIIYATVGQHSIHIRMDGQAAVSPGDTVEIGFQPGRANLFDPVSENRL